MKDSESYIRFVEQNCCVIVPTYNNDTTLKFVLDGILKYTDRIVIIDDGSTDGTKGVLSGYDKLDILTQEANFGKGAALRRAFLYAKEKGYRYAITIDSDGQHLTDDLPAFLDKLDDAPDSVIVGARNMGQSGIPKKSSFGHKFSNFWFKFETGVSLPDTQSGYRLYPLELIADKNYVTNKFEFEIEVIVRAAWNGVNVTSVPVGVIYKEESERVSHFRPFQDFSRVSVLNTILVFISLFYVRPRNFIKYFRKENLLKFIEKNIMHNKNSNLKIALSVALGVFVGITPFWGYQTAIALLLAYILRLDKLIVIISSNISIMPPIIIYLSYITGGLFMGENAFKIEYSSDITIELIKANFYQYVIGSLTFGAIMALLLSGATYVSLSIFRKHGAKKREGIA
ncbi:DUF2062 domain-containing protein [Thermodesulfobacteriota bacterium]